MRNQRPKDLKFHAVNETGFLIEKACALPEIKFYEEGGSVLFFATVAHPTNDGEEVEALQYLTPEIAMKMAKSLEACAIQAFKKV